MFVPWSLLDEGVPKQVQQANATYLHESLLRATWNSIFSTSTVLIARDD